MLQVLFDTNIYGKIVADEQREAVIKAILKSHLRVLNFRLVRDELRQTSKQKIVAHKRKLRAFLLRAYDEIATASPTPVSRNINQLADLYFSEYKRLGGNVGKTRILSDLKIMACATLHRCDLVFSDDHHVMRGSPAISACRIVNAIGNLRSPRFHSYGELKHMINVSYCR